MFRLNILGASLTLACATSSTLGAQQTSLSVTGPSVSMVISGAAPGSQPTAIVASTSTYSVTAKKNAGTKKIVGQLTAPMPAGTTMTVELTAVAGAISTGPVAMDMTARDLEISIEKENRTTETITYRFSATVAAGVVPSQSRTVIYTLLDYP